MSRPNNQRPRLLIIAFTFPPDKNGVSHAADMMADEMSACGWEVDVLAAPPLESEYDPALIRSSAVRVTTTSSIDDFNPDYLEKTIAKLSPDIVVIHSWYRSLNMLEALERLSLPAVLVSHSYNDHLIHWRRKPPFFGVGSWVKRLPNVVETMMGLKKLSAFVSLSGNSSFVGNFDLLCARILIPDRWLVIPNAVDPLPKSNFSFRQKYGIAQHSFMVIQVANFSERKNQLFSAKSLKKCPLENMSFVYVGQERNEYARRVEEAAKGDARFTFIYGAERTHVEAGILEADLCCLCSESEMQPLFLLEAMAFQKPWISTNAGCAKELGGGVIVPARSSQWRKKIMELYHSPSLRAELGEAGFLDWSKNHQKSITSEKWDHLLRVVLERGNGWKQFL